MGRNNTCLLYTSGREIKRYVNKVHMKIKPSDNALCEDERIDREDCIYKLEELKAVSYTHLDVYKRQV